MQAITPRGEVAGEQFTREGGILPFLHIYGEDPEANPPIPGFREEEPIVLRVSNIYTETIGFGWSNDWRDGVHYVVVGAQEETFEVFLSMVVYNPLKTGARDSGPYASEVC